MIRTERRIGYADGPRIYLFGDTYNVRQRIKQLGGKWDDEVKGWWLRDRPLDGWTDARLSEFLADLNNEATVAKSNQRETESARIAIYRNLPHEVIWAGKTRDGSYMAKLVNPESKREFWAPYTTDSTNPQAGSVIAFLQSDDRTVPPVPASTAASTTPVDEFETKDRSGPPLQRVQPAAESAKVVDEWSETVAEIFAEERKRKQEVADEVNRAKAREDEDYYSGRLQKPLSPRNRPKPPKPAPPPPEPPPVQGPQDLPRRRIRL